MIPGAAKPDGTPLGNASQCGGKSGLGTANEVGEKTVCSK